MFASDMINSEPSEVVLEKRTLDFKPRTWVMGYIKLSSGHKLLSQVHSNLPFLSYSKNQSASLEGKVGYAACPEVESGGACKWAELDSWSTEVASDSRNHSNLRWPMRSTRF